MRFVLVLHSLIAFASILSGPFLCPQRYFLSSGHHQESIGLTRASRKSLNEATLRQIANEITVEIIAEDRKYGSGIIVASYENQYTVVTNEHVVFSGNSIRIVAHDGQAYDAQKLPLINSEEFDLAILQFSSNTRYLVADYNASQYNSIVGDIVFASGYPATEDTSEYSEFTFVSGQIGMITNAFIEGGYQIGSTLDLEKGMSGGPLLNADGEVIGINGMHKYPLWGNP